MHPQHLTGIQYLDAATALVRRVRHAHLEAGLLEAADLHWWWRAPRSTDGLPQLFWFDESGQPTAAVIATDWGDAVALDPIWLPGMALEEVAHVLERGLAHASELGLRNLDVVTDSADTFMHQLLTRHGFAAAPDGMLNVTITCLPSAARPPVSLLADGYRLCTRLDTSDRPHHLTKRNSPELEARLLQSSLYRPDLDLLVLDTQDEVAAYGLFWFDPDTATGLIEPVRTEKAHQQRGLARHLLTAGADRLAAAGAKHIKLCFKPTNEAARNLYLNVGFQPYKQTAVFSRAVPSPPSASIAA